MNHHAMEAGPPSAGKHRASATDAARRHAPDPRRTCARACAALLPALLLAMAAPAWADVTLRQALDLAWQRAVQPRVAEARRAEADASRIAADSWLARAPSIGIAERNDRIDRNRGDRERELELALPFWLPAQRDARLALAGKEAQDGDAALVAARLGLAGDLRIAIWSLALARAERDLAAERLVAAQGLEADVRRREKAGDLARVDLLAAGEETLAARVALADAETRARQSLERYRLLTGLDTLPDHIEETVTPADGTAHPRLRLAEAAVERARAEMQVAREIRRDPPEFSVGVRQARDDYTAPERGTLRIGVRIPLATESRNAPRIAAANTALIRAEAEQRRAMAEIDTEQREAADALVQAEAAERAARERAVLADERLNLLDRAFALGELPLVELLRARGAAMAARFESARGAHGLNAARARLNQARGLLP